MSHHSNPPSEETIGWLLDSDPSIRWQVLAHLTDASPNEVAGERSRVSTEGWGAEILELQDSEGRWDGGTYRPGWVDETKPFFDAWTATHFSLSVLRELGLHADSTEAKRAVGLVRDHVRWDANDAAYFDGESEPCINGLALANGSYFGQSVDGLGELLVDGQLGDGGWNCWVEHGANVSSFHTTICVLEGLLAWEKSGGSSAELTSARLQGEEYLLRRRLFRSASSGQVVDPRFTMFSHPTYWYYDVLRGLDYFRASGWVPDERSAEAIELVASRCDSRGRWPVENRHQGPTHLRMDGPEGSPSRWNTLRALRVLDWANGGAQPAARA